MNNKLLVFTLFALTISSKLSAVSLDAHIHGKVNLDIASDKDELLIMLKTPSESILGFEYMAKSEAEKKLIKLVKEDWNNNLFKFFNLEKAEYCKVTSSKWEQIFSGKNHSHILAESYIKCKGQLKEKSLTIALKKYCKNIVEINIQLIRADGSVLNKKHTKEIFNIKL